MVKEKKVLNAKMREILRILHKKGGSMSALEISNETGFAYKTTIKYLEEMKHLGIIEGETHGRKNKVK